jgi:hypothetical protein
VTGQILDYATSAMLPLKQVNHAVGAARAHRFTPPTCW